MVLACLDSLLHIGYGKVKDFVPFAVFNNVFEVVERFAKAVIGKAILGEVVGAHFI